MFVPFEGLDAIVIKLIFCGVLFLCHGFKCLYEANLSIISELSYSAAAVLLADAEQAAGVAAGERDLEAVGCADGLGWTISLAPWYESMPRPREAKVVSGKKAFGLVLPGRYLDEDIDQLKEDALRRAAAMNQFDSVWAGFKCKDCGRRKFCGNPILK